MKEVTREVKEVKESHGGHGSECGQEGEGDEEARELYYRMHRVQYCMIIMQSSSYRQSMLMRLISLCILETILATLRSGITSEDFHCSHARHVLSKASPCGGPAGLCKCQNRRASSNCKLPSSVHVGWIRSHGPWW